VAGGARRAVDDDVECRAAGVDGEVARARRWAPCSAVPHCQRGVWSILSRSASGRRQPGRSGIRIRGPQRWGWVGRHSFAPRLLGDGTGLLAQQELPRHADVSATMTSTLASKLEGPASSSLFGGSVALGDRDPRCAAVVDVACPVRLARASCQSFLGARAIQRWIDLGWARSPRDRDPEQREEKRNGGTARQPVQEDGAAQSAVVR